MTPEPVAYDKSIKLRKGIYKAIVRKDDKKWEFPRLSLLEAQRLLDCFPDDVYEGLSVPFSVFFRSSRCATHVM